MGLVIRYSNLEIVITKLLNLNIEEFSFILTRLVAISRNGGK